MKRYLYTMFACLLLLSHSSESSAWATPGHNAIGMLAASRLQDETRDRLEDIVGPLNAATVGAACNWPDVIRDEARWEWSKPQHYVNIPRGDFKYLKIRDCPDGRCATEAIKRYASELADESNSRERRWQAFAWLCHLVADLHQPMHAGFGDDRGGNDFGISIDGEEYNLHYYWDRIVLEQNSDDWKGLLGRVQSAPVPAVKTCWEPSDVDMWTNESHQLSRHRAYPPSAKLDAVWEKQAWEIAVERINLAAARLALVIETLFAD